MDRVIYLVRHTQVALDRGICYGQTDVDVADTFAVEAEIIKAKLQGISFARVLSSPLTRCMKLALAITPKIETDNRLMEMNFGNWEGKTWEYIFSTEEGKAWFANYLNQACPKGESFNDLQNRVSQFVDTLANVQANVLIIAHAGVIRAMLTALDLADCTKIFDIDVPYGQLIKIEQNKYECI